MSQHSEAIADCIERLKAIEASPTAVKDQETDTLKEILGQLKLLEGHMQNALWHMSEETKRSQQMLRHHSKAVEKRSVLEMLVRHLCSLRNLTGSDIAAECILMGCDP